MTRQCELLCIHRSGLYYQPRQESEKNLTILRMMDEQYMKTPFYGLPKLTAWLRSKGYLINHKRIDRLMKLMGWQTIYRRKWTSKPDKANPVYPYLLKGLIIDRPGQVYAMDITYVPMRRGFLYLCAVIDLYNRKVLNWSLSNTMTAGWCRQVAEEAMERYGVPEIFNTDQGSQFTSEVFTSLLLEKGVRISMDGVGRAADNIIIERLWRTVKYEHIYLHVAEDGVELYEGLKEYFEFYNQERPHQSLGYKTPAEFVGTRSEAA
jgi:putative transposase